MNAFEETAESTRTAILEACQLKPAELFLCAIHTHSAPSLTLDSAKGHANNIAYTKGLQLKLVGAVKIALNGLEPVQLGTASGSCPVGVNRREVVRSESGTNSIKLGRNPGGPSDPEVQVLKLARISADKPAAVLFAYATHSTSLGPNNYIVSGERITLGRLEDLLKTAAVNNPGRGSVILRADKRCAWEFVVAAMNACNKAKIYDYRVTFDPRLLPEVSVCRFAQGECGEEVVLAADAGADPEAARARGAQWILFH